MATATLTGSPSRRGVSALTGSAPNCHCGSTCVGGEDVLMDGAAPAGISVADLAMAIVDQIGQPQHVKARFTVASTQA